jgi:hypothetical protein
VNPLWRTSDLRWLEEVSVEVEGVSGGLKVSVACAAQGRSLDAPMPRAHIALAHFLSSRLPPAAASSCRSASSLTAANFQSSFGLASLTPGVRPPPAAVGGDTSPSRPKHAHKLLGQACGGGLSVIGRGRPWHAKCLLLVCVPTDTRQTHKAQAQIHKRASLSALHFAQALYDSKVLLGQPHPRSWYGNSIQQPPAQARSGFMEGGAKMETPLRAAADNTEGHVAGLASAPAVTSCKEPVSREDGEKVAEGQGQGQGMTGLEREREVEELRAERDKWVDFAGRLRSLLGLGEGRGGGAGLLNVVKKEFDARDHKIKSMSERIARLESDATQRDHACSARQEARAQVADKLAALEHNTQRSVWDERVGSARRKKTFAQKFCEGKSKRAVSVPPLIANMIENSNRRPYARDAYDGGSGEGRLSSLGGADEILLPRIGRGNDHSSSAARGGWKSSLA